jgi:hypothetical protein
LPQSVDEIVPFEGRRKNAKEKESQRENPFVFLLTSGRYSDTEAKTVTALTITWISDYFFIIAFVHFFYILFPHPLAKNPTRCGPSAATAAYV